MIDFFLHRPSLQRYRQSGRAGHRLVGVRSARRDSTSGLRPTFDAKRKELRSVDGQNR